jgi:predicted  nucleic acid-binding Zn-ribbon protein
VERFEQLTEAQEREIAAVVALIEKSRDELARARRALAEMRALVERMHELLDTLAARVARPE